MADAQKFFQLQSQTLAGSGVSVADTTMILTSFKDIDGNNVAMTDFGDKGWMTIEPGSADREEQISFTGITQNANGTATITGIKNVGFKAPYTETSGFLKSHPGGVKAVISNTAGFYANLASKDNDETISGQWIFTNPKIPKMDVYSIPTDDEQLATKKYVDDTAGGSPISINRIVVGGTAGATVAAGKVVYLDETDNEWKLADGSASATCDNVQLGIAQGSGTDGNPISGGVLLQGRDANQSGFAQGDRIYISDTAGTLANSAGTVEVEVGHAISATEIDFQPKFASFTTKLQRDALVGTSGTPSTTNKFVTADDVKTTTTADKVVRALGTGLINTNWVDVGTGANQVVQLDGSSKLPAVDGSNLTNVITRKVGVATYDATTASGSQTIAHGLGTTPAVVRLRGSYGGANWSASSFGVFNGSTNSVSWETSNAAGAGDAGADTTNSIYMVKSTVGNRQTGVVSVDATNITITWTKVGSPDDTIHIQWEVQDK
jgi:hypothetical protein